MTNQNAAAAWPAPLARRPLNAIVEIPGSKSLSNRYLILAALGGTPTVLHGLLLSRDTELMMKALQSLGVEIEQDFDAPTTVRVTPPASGYFSGDTDVFCGLAGTVMRFVPGLALFADGPVHFRGDDQASVRPMKPVLEGLEQLGARVEYEGEPGRLPFTVTPPAVLPDSLASVSIDSSGSSQFISGLLLIASRLPGGLHLTHTGKKLPSMPHINMTVADVRAAGGTVESPARGEWNVTPAALSLPSSVVVEPDLSNAAPFLGAALIAGGSVSVPHWPEHTTQPGALLPDILERFGASISYSVDVAGRRVLTVAADGAGAIRGLGDLDLSAAGEIAPSIAALTVFADAPTNLVGIAHLRGHETNRLLALVTEINRIGGSARELDDGIGVTPVPVDAMRGTSMETYADHRMATFAAMIGLALPGVGVIDVETTRKTLPDFVGMWTAMLAQ
ncbi:MAG: 3-phosphoshikimate 1-carboxyvinyltransferase [Bifidobacteriaceae bacterium]|jgi:3-phosphoshikimate 1-carboxyvinyltransferase|nr:3-phosphoshikimate 1-carboxyvinyltransferase [Bifidobacteriaceae bacterium]